MQRLICHLIDTNLDTNYFRSIARYHNAALFPVMIGSLAPVGPLQQAMRMLKTPSFALRAPSRWQYPLGIIRLVRLLRRHKVALLHGHCFDPTLVGLVAARLAGVPFVFTRHHSDHNIRIGKHYHTRVDSWCARHADHVIAVSEATRRIMLEVESVPDQQITVVHNGMETLRQPDPQSVVRLRHQLGLSGEYVCLMLARLHEEKGFRYLFDAVPEIESRSGPLVVLIAGEGPHRGVLEGEVQKRGLQGSVRFLGRRHDVPELLAIASVVAVPSLAESFGFVCLEAMSVGRPVVASTTGGIPEVVADEKTGLLVPPADSASLAKAICHILQDPEWARTLGEAGQQRAALFAFDRMMSGYEAVYQRVIGQRL